MTVTPLPPRPAPVGVRSWSSCVVRLLPILLPWLLVVVLGRGVCLVAQRVPPVVLLVRAIRSRRAAAAARLAAQAAP